MDKDKVIVITGPTASGKTSLAVKLAKRIDGEIISADSMQIYKYMDIGSAKPDKEEMAGIPHYMLDFLHPSVKYSVAEYKIAAEKCIEDILKKGKRPIIAGGTGLYINSLVYNIDYSVNPGRSPMRKKLKNLAEERGNKYLQKKLKKVDPEAAKKIHVHNTRRLVRALEVCYTEDTTYTQKKKEALKNPPKYDYKVYMLNLDRSVLYDRINKRVDVMIEKGLEKEARKLYDMNLKKDSTSLQGIGYKEFFNYFNGLLTFEELLVLIKRGTRRYAKRQITWMKKIRGIKILNLDGMSQQDVLKQIMKSV